MRSGRILFGLILALFSSPLLVFGQGQQPMVLIDFEGLSGPSSPVGGFAPQTLQVQSATFSGGEVLTNGGGVSPADGTEVYASYIPPPTLPSDGCDDCDYPRVEIDFNQKITGFSALLLSGTTNWFPDTYTIWDDQGGYQQITLAAGGAGAISLPDSGIRQVFISAGYGIWYFAIDNVQFTPMAPVFLDPVDSGFLSGPQVTTNTDQLSKGGVVVTGIAADASVTPSAATGVTEAVVRIPANQDGESLSVSVQDDAGNQSNATSGGLFQLGGSPQSELQTLNVNAVHTPNGPMAFVIYLSPTNFARGSQDYNTAERAISLQIQSNDYPNYNLTANASVVRPPVLLVHGLWESAEDWGRQGFSLSPIDGLDVDTIDYYYPLLQGVTATSPTYDSGYLDVNNIPTSALGLSYNAPLVDGQIRQGISDFRHINNAAAVTADVVAHSMGGDIVRTIALGSGFQNNETYGHGPIDKLITIGTPHLGSPLATDLLRDANKCVRQQLAKNGTPSFITVTTSAGSPINGGVGDLQGDGIPNGFLSGALQELSNAGPLPFPMARISAMEGYSNLAGLSCGFPCAADLLRLRCGTFLRDPLALALTPTEWEPMVFGAPPGEEVSDAVVPITSQLNGGSGTPLPGVIHSPGMELLDLNGPTELDAGSDVLGAVINLLNEPPSGSDFQ